MPDIPTEQKLIAFEKVLQVGTVFLLTVCLFFLKDIYGRFQILETTFRTHELSTERRISTLEASSGYRTLAPKEGTESS
jgi:hypothetical protein